MNKIYIIILAMLAACGTFVSCSDDDPFSTAGETDDPRILDPIFPDRVNGELAVVRNINRDTDLEMTVTVTPADFTTVKWYIDGSEVAEGTELKTSLPAGTYNLKVVATTTAGKSTYREGTVKVNALDGDPYSEAAALERIIAPGTSATIYGSNLDKVASMKIGEVTVSGIEYTAAEDGGSITYSVPTGIAAGVYRLTLVDADGNEYGANTVTVSSSALVTSGASRATSGAEWVLSGINLDAVASLSVNGQEITAFTRQSANEIALTCPVLADGEYTLTGKMKDGGAVQFVAGTEIADAATVTVSSETVLWEGHHYVSWDYADDSPNKKFSQISKEQFLAFKPGSKLRIYYSVAAEADYHKMQTTTGWWTMLPGTGEMEFSEDGVVEIVITSEILDLVGQQDGFLCVGHGYYVDRVTIQ